MELEMTEREGESDEALYTGSLYCFVLVRVRLGHLITVLVNLGVECPVPVYVYNYFGFDWSYLR